MIQIEQANLSHVQGISAVCAAGYRATYSDSHSSKYIERIIKEFYHPERIAVEVANKSKDWGGYYVALDNARVIGAAGGGMISNTEGEMYVLYMDPSRRNEGIGTRLLAAVTERQKTEFNASGQWVSVQKGNTKGIPFYEARGFLFKHEQKSYANEEGEEYISLRYYREI